MSTLAPVRTDPFRDLAIALAELPSDSPACTSGARHDCAVEPVWECRGDGERVLWCQSRYEDWLYERERLRCRECGGSESHWIVTPYKGKL